MADPSTSAAGAIGASGTVDGVLEPLFRWPGGKRWLTPVLLGLIPDSPSRYFEPFVGAGALFFALRPQAAVLGDKNGDLIHAYAILRDEPAALGAALRAMPRDATSYYAIRASQPSKPIERAARFVYLATLAFNGIYRVNRAGNFNVPYGGRAYAGAWADDVIQQYGLALRGADLRSGDFEAALDGASSGDFAYLDPPYTVAHSNNGFLRYNERIFSWEDQERLARVAAALNRRGCAVVVSNAPHPEVRALYQGFRELVVPRASTIAATSDGRRVTEESVFTNV